MSTFAALADYASFQDEDQQVWRPDFFWFHPFLVASFFAPFRPRAARGAAAPAADAPGQIAWLNMLGSVFFMVSAFAASCCPADSWSTTRSPWGTLFGAVCSSAPP